MRSGSTIQSCRSGDRWIKTGTMRFKIEMGVALSWELDRTTTIPE